MVRPTQQLAHCAIAALGARRQGAQPPIVNSTSLPCLCPDAVPAGPFCPAGKASAAAGASSIQFCLDCVPGRFAPAPGFVSCTPWFVVSFTTQRFTFSPAVLEGHFRQYPPALHLTTARFLQRCIDRTEPQRAQDCPQGTFGPNQAASSRAQCFGCGAGTFALAGASACFQCQAGVACALRPR